MTETIKSMRDARAWQDLYNPGSPEIGDEAPDFELRDSQGENPLHLSDFRGEKPIALVFGSFT